MKNAQMLELLSTARLGITQITKYHIKSQNITTIGLLLLQGWNFAFNTVVYLKCNINILFEALLHSYNPVLRKVFFQKICRCQSTNFSQTAKVAPKVLSE